MLQLIVYRISILYRKLWRGCLVVLDIDVDRDSTAVSTRLRCHCRQFLFSQLKAKFQSKIHFYLHEWILKDCYSVATSFLCISTLYCELAFHHDIEGLLGCQINKVFDIVVDRDSTGVDSTLISLSTSTNWSRNVSTYVFLNSSTKLRFFWKNIQEFFKL